MADESAPNQPYPAAHVDIRGTEIVAIVLAGAVFVLHEAAALVVPILIALLLSYALEPFVASLIRLRLPRFIAATIVYLALAMVVGVGIRAARPQVRSFLDDMPKNAASFKQIVRARGAVENPSGPLGQVQTAAREIDKAVTEAAGARAERPGVKRVAPVSKPFDLSDYFVDFGVALASVTTHAFIVGLLAFLLLATGDVYKWKLVEFAGPQLEQRKVTLDIIRAIDHQIQRYLVARLLISVIVAVATGVALWAIGMNHAPIWGCIAGILNVLPFIGPTAAVALITAAAFLQFHSLETPALAFVLSSAVAALEGNLLTPWLTSRAGELNTVSVFLSVLVFGWMWEMWGLLLAIPIMVAVKAAADHIEPLQPIGELLGR